MSARWSACVLGVALAGCASSLEAARPWPARLLGPTADGRAAIVGRIVDESERPVAGVVVSLSCLCLEGPRETPSGADGTYGFTGLPNGRYTVELEQHSFANRLEVPPGMRYRVNFRVDRKP